MRRVFLAYRKPIDGMWQCSWGSFTHGDYRVVIDHENSEHGGKNASK